MKVRKLFEMCLLLISLTCYSQDNATIYNSIILDEIDEWDLPGYISNHPEFSHVGNILKLGDNIALQITYKAKGFNKSDYPYKEVYVPKYFATQTAWDTVFIFSYPDQILINKLALKNPMDCIKSVQWLKWPDKEMFLVQYFEGAELHLSSETIHDSVLFINHELDLVTVSPNGKTLTYVDYTESGAPEFLENCMVNYDIKQRFAYPYNYQVTVPVDGFVEENVSQIAAVPEYDRYVSFSYNANNELVYFKSNEKPIRIKTSILKPANYVYYSDDAEYEKPKVIASKYIDGFLYILSFVDDFEMDYKGYTLSMLSVQQNEYLVHNMRVSVTDDGNKIEYNPATSSPSEIQHHITFGLEPDYKKDSLTLLSYLPADHDFYPRDYVFSVKDSILVFSEADGLVKMNLNSKEYIKFGYPDILAWFNNMGSTHTLHDYKSIFITEENKIITVQENNMIMIWEVQST